MSVITITGRPGFGKTLNMVYESLRNFDRDNPKIKIWWTEKILRKDWIYVVNEYSNLPILLVPERKNKKPYTLYCPLKNEIYQLPAIYSHEVRLFDLRIKYNYNPTARFYIDEIQAMYDSMEYRDFPDCIAHFFQTHRHLEYADIYTNSQSISRIIKRVLVVSEEYRNIYDRRQFLGWITTRYKVTYDLATSKEEKLINENNFEVEYFARTFRKKRVFKSYNTKYLKGLKEKGIDYHNRHWESLTMSYDDIMHCFFPTPEEKKELLEERY